MRKRRTCEACGSALPPREGPYGASRDGRPARYCSSACRQRAFRQRAAAAAQQTAEPHAPDAEPAAPEPRGLPRALDRFIGREPELARLPGLLRSSRLLTLTGPGGVGKSRLALELAGRTRAARDGRARLVELDTLHDGELLPQAVAVQLGVGERGGRTGVEALVGALDARTTLLVLDNCEHLVGPCAQLAAELLGRCSRLRILATSREPLRVPGEVVFRVGPLSLPTDAASPHSDAVRLFEERARAGEPGFTLRHGDAGTVAEICRHLDGLPLAIELAARRVGSLSTGDILHGLDDQLVLLTDGNRTGPGRHRELAAAVDWSHRLLDPVEQAVFRRLSVLEGGFDIGGATAVCTGGEVSPQQVLPAVADLEAKSLIVRGWGHEQGEAGDPGRFRQLTAIRAYGAGRLEESGELHATWRRALDWLTGLADRDRDAVFADTAAGPLLAERENIAAAVAYTDRADARAGSRRVPLTLALARVRYQQEQLTAARTLLSDVLDPGSAPSPAASPHLGAVLSLAARAACQQADRHAALAYAEEAVTRERRSGGTPQLANALDALAAARLCRGEFSEAAVVFAECLETVRTLDRPLDTALCRHHLAWALLHVDRVAEADELMAACLPDLRAGASAGQLAGAVHTAGAIDLARGRAEAARERFAEVLRGAPRESLHSSYPLEGLGLVAAEQDDAQRALRLLGAAGAVRRRIDTEPEPHWQRQLDEATARARHLLAPAAADATLTAGRRLRGEELLAYALQGTGVVGTEGPAAATGDEDTAAAAPLTERERSVAALVADGLTNRQIAARLHVSRSTVASHLDNVRDKLGMRSRTQIALWVTGQARRNP